MVDELAFSEVLAKSVEELTDDDITKFILALRSERVAVLAAEASKTRTPKSPITKAAGKASAAQINFEDLGL